MSDVFSDKERSKIMRAVKSRENKSTELRLIRAMKAKKITGWRRNYKLFGRPDFVFSRQRIAVFCDGCFWHGHDCRNTKPRDHSEYWQKKIERNKRRDALVAKTLKAKGWNVVRMWECEIAKDKTEKLEKALSSK